jgi:hypothetical protein
MADTGSPRVELRVAAAEDEGKVRWLAALDERPAPARPVLLALVDGQATAALSLTDGRVVGNPFVPNAEVTSLLRVRAAQLGRSGRRRRRLRPL